MFEFIRLFRWQDAVDILVVAFVIYQLISIIRGTRSVQMVLGLGVLVAVYFMASVLELATLLWLLQTFLSSLFIIVIIVFQDDIRRALTQVGKSPLSKGNGYDGQGTRRNHTHCLLFIQKAYWSVNCDRAGYGVTRLCRVRVCPRCTANQRDTDLHLYAGVAAA